MAFFIPGIRALWSGRGGDDPSSEKAESEDVATEADTERDDKGAAAEPSAAGAHAPRTMRTYAREAAALVLIASGLYWGLALASFEADPLRPAVSGANWVGPVGEVLARSAVKLVGLVAWLVPLELVVLAGPLLVDRRIKLNVARFGGDVVVAVILAALAHISLPGVVAFGNMPLGGAIGGLFGEVLRALFSTVGSFLIGLTIVGLILVERSTFSFIASAQRFAAFMVRLRHKADRSVEVVGDAWARARAADRELRERERRASEPLIASPEQADAIIAAFADQGDDWLPPFVPRKAANRARNGKVDSPVSGDSVGAGRSSLAVGSGTVSAPPRAARLDDGRPSRGSDAETPSPSASAAATPTPSTPSPICSDSDGAQNDRTPNDGTEAALSGGRTPPAPEAVTETGEGSTAAGSLRKTGRSRKPAEPTIVDTSEAAKTKKARRRVVETESKFKLPPPDLLDSVEGDAPTHDIDKLKETARKLEKTLLDYRVEGKVMEIHPGPTVTMFEVSPAPGTKVSKVAGLADDLALGLSRKVRIVAPIPGKNRIGFEVPNDSRIPVNLRELVESQDFMELKAPLPCVLGRDLIGRPVFADLASMPHVIVAGATGTGKSVGLNVMLMSLLYRRTPEEMRLLMIDPKVVELAPFDRIPHLLFPVVTDMKQASNALKWAVDEMERRYQLFADAGTRNITTFNRWATRVRAGELPRPRPKMVDAIAPDGTQLELPALKDGSDDTLPDKLPFIVIVIEEFADLMMTQGKEVEASVARLAQKARAAGLHVILATQRPSVDVITGMIKANFPTRVAYRVAQKVDSRTILDQQGAEHLLGRGDMLVRLNGTTDMKRIQCPFVSEDEVQRVTDMLRAQGEPEYDESIVRGRDDDAEEADSSDAESDPLYDQAVQIVADTQKCSTSWIQRKLGIGYNRAAKIVETMEKNGLIGPPNGSKPRDINISPQ